MTLNRRSFAITVFLSITLLSTPVTMNGVFAQQSENKIPSWVKNNAGWWADGSIDESSFVNGMQYLIKEDIMQIPQTTQGSTASSEVPSWVKNNAGWWADGSIDDDSFVQGIQFLVKEGVMQVSTDSTSSEETPNILATPDSTSEETTTILAIPSDSVIQEKNKPQTKKDSDSKNNIQNNNRTPQSKIDTAEKPSKSKTLQDMAQKLKDKTKNNGKVRVIVELTTDFKSSLSKENQANQRASISGEQNSLMNSLSTDGVFSYRNFKHTPQMVITVNENTLNQLLSSKMVKSIQEDMLHEIHLDETIPIVDPTDVIPLGFDGSGQTVAILDTGIAASHDFFAKAGGGNRIVEQACFTTDRTLTGNASKAWLCGANAAATTGTESDTTTTNIASPCSIDGGTTVFTGCDHGTHVAGIAAGNNVGNSGPTSGVAKDANIITIQVFTIVQGTGDAFHDCKGGTVATPSHCLFAYTSDIISGLGHVATLAGTYDISSVNLSLGTSFPFIFEGDCDNEPEFGGDGSNPIEPIITTLRNTHGIATIAASGNDGDSSSISSPACVSSAIAVSSTNDLNGKPLFENESPEVDFFAPGVDVESSVPGAGDDVFAEKDGTSMSTPHVTGAWAVLAEADNTATLDEIYSALYDTGTPVALDLGGISRPLIQLEAALNELLGPICDQDISFYDSVLMGTEFSDILRGTSGNDLIIGHGGDDSLIGNAGNDCIQGGAGADKIVGGVGFDNLQGGAGDDTIRGDENADIIDGGPDNDTLVGGSGEDTIDGGTGADSIQGGADNDTINGGDGNDTISGDGGDDTINGDADDDAMAGRDGNDTCNGGTGNDSPDSTCETIT